MINRFQHFAAYITCINRHLQRIERRVMSEHELKGPQAQILVIMRYHREGITVSELSIFCDKDKGGISRAVSELEKAGMLVRTGKNGNIYRAKLVLTEKGQVCAKLVNEEVNKAVEQIGHTLSDQDRDVFYKVLEMIADNLQKLS